MPKENIKLKIKEISNSSNPSFVNTTEYTKQAIQTDKKKVIKLIERLESQIKNNSELLKEKEENLLQAKEYMNLLVKLEVNI